MERESLQEQKEQLLKNAKSDEYNTLQAREAEAVEEAQTPEPQPADYSIEDWNKLIDDAIDKGQWLERQAEAESQAHTSCPACSKTFSIFKNLAKGLQKSIEYAEKLHDLGQHNDALVSLIMSITWCDRAKDAVIDMHACAHEPFNIMKAHPELAIKKSQRRSITSGKHQRKMAKKSRRKNRRK